MTAPTDAFDDDGDALADADTHGAKRITPAGSDQLIGCGRNQTRPRHPQRMAERNGATVRVYACVVIRQAQIAQDCQRLRGKGLVQFNDIHLFQRKARPVQNLAHRRNRPDAHNTRRNACGGHSHDTGLWRQAM
jgi:hypothetical protein